MITASPTVVARRGSVSCSDVIEESAHVQRVRAWDNSVTIDLGELAREVLEFLARTHSKPGARMLIGTLATRLRSTDPAMSAAVSELVRAGYVRAPDAETIELTAEGFDAIQRGI